MGHSSESGESCMINNVSINQRFCCTITNCTASFNRQWKLDGHIHRHKNERPFACVHKGCSKSYFTNSHLKRHVHVSHREKEKEKTYLPCPFDNCLKYFASRSSVNKHVKSHSRIQYSCAQCSAAFKKHNQLTTHMYVHTGVYPLSCEECGQGFLTKKNKLRHAKKHQTYSCEYQNCEAVLENWTSLRKHKKQFHPLIYHCDNCPKTFYNKKWLEDHVLSHVAAEEKDIWECPIVGCSRIFYHKRNLVQHTRSFHEGKGYPCLKPDCGRIFSSKVNLGKHQTHHDTKTIVSAKRKKNITKTRKDKGKPHISMISVLTGIKLPHSIDKKLINNDTSEETDLQVRKLLKRINEKFIVRERGDTVEKREECEEKGTSKEDYVHENIGDKLPARIEI